MKIAWVICDWLVSRSYGVDAHVLRADLFTPAGDY